MVPKKFIALLEEVGSALLRVYDGNEGPSCTIYTSAEPEGPIGAGEVWRGQVQLCTAPCMTLTRCADMRMRNASQSSQKSPGIVIEGLVLVCDS